MEDEEEPQEEDDGDQATVKDEKKSDTVEWASEGEHEEDEEASASAARLQVEATEAFHLDDEPTASLDPDTGDMVRSWLERYRAASGCTILLASHNMAEVERMCSHVVMLKQGRIVDQGSPDDLLARYGRDDLEEVFLDIARNRRESI